MSHLLQKVAVGALLVLPVFAVPVMAEDSTNSTETETHNTTATTETSNETEHPSRAEGKLSDVRKKICENRQTRITQIMNRAATNGTRLLEVFNKGLTRVEDFYTSKHLSVANYDTLVAAANSKKQAATDAIQAVKDGMTLDCTGTNPVGKINVFISKVKTMQQALKDFRSSIRDIIKAVKPVAEAAETEGSKQ